MQRSLAVILSVGGAQLDARAVADVPMARVAEVDLVSGMRSAAASATLVHDCSRADLARALRGWAAGRGWSVTVAPLPRGG
jgi:hypothetical protein